MSSEQNDTVAASAELKSIPDVGAAEQSPAGSNKAGGKDRATSEASALESGKSSRQLEKEAKAAEHSRSERFRNHFERITLTGLYLAAIVFLVMTSIWLFHLAAPTCWRWLSSNDLSTLQNFVTGGVIATIAAGHIKKRLG